MISDDTIAKNLGDTVFPDTTTMIYYPKDNPTWNNYDFTKLMKVVQATGVDKKICSILLMVRLNKRNNK